MASFRLPPISYPSIACGFFGLCALLTYAVEVDRVPVQYHSIFLAFKLFFGLLAIGQGLMIYFWGFSDKHAVVMFTHMVFYSLMMMWFAPVYEVAYFQCAIGCSFTKLKRSWIFPLVYGLGLIAIFCNYYLMDQYGWSSPAAERADWAGIMLVSFFLAWFIQKYAIGAYRKEQDRLARFGIVGQETTRLTHDIKGLLSSPLLIIDTLQNKEGSVSVETYRSQMKLLAKDMENVHAVLRSIHRLVAVGDQVEQLEIAEAVMAPLKVLERRMGHIEVSLPAERKVKANPDRLHSIFFNLLLNSLEAFETNCTAIPRINIFWDGDVLCYVDNAGGMGEGKEGVSTKSQGSGLGLQLVRTDLEKMGAAMRITSEPPLTRIALSFAK